MEITIRHTAGKDTNNVFRLYEDAIAYQKIAGNNHWLGFERDLITREILEKRHFVVTSGDIVAATFVITLEDPLIWSDSVEVAAVYIHRIATSNNFRGKKMLQHILDWAKVYAGEMQLNYIRLDTGAGNDSLINYYIKNGFTYLGDTTVIYTPELPLHYKDGKFALFQMDV